MCECGAWKNYEVLEDELTLDELFILYEATTKRVRRFMDTVAAALGADVSHSDSGGSKVEYDQGAFIPDGSLGDSASMNKDVNMSYVAGGIGPGDHDHFAYFQKEVAPEAAEAGDE
mgnify:CR=1 FL=1